MEAHEIFEKHHEESQKTQIIKTRLLLAPPLNLAFFFFVRWYYHNYQRVARRILPGAVGAVGAYVLIPIQSAVAMTFWFVGNLQILGINVTKYNELLEKQTQEEEELLLKMKQEQEMQELRLRAKKTSLINQEE